MIVLNFQLSNFFIIIYYRLDDIFTIKSGSRFLHDDTKVLNVKLICSQCKAGCTKLIEVFKYPEDISTDNIRIKQTGAQPWCTTIFFDLCESVWH